MKNSFLLFNYIKCKIESLKISLAPPKCCVLIFTNNTSFSIIFYEQLISQSSEDFICVCLSKKIFVSIDAAVVHKSRLLIYIKSWVALRRALKLGCVDTAQTCLFIPLSQFLYEVVHKLVLNITIVLTSQLTKSDYNAINTCLRLSRQCLIMSMIIMQASVP